MWNRRWLPPCLLVPLLLAACSAPDERFDASLDPQITDGIPDEDAHPYVGLLVFDVDGAPAWRCSGTLLSERVMLTAGHCTDGAEGGRVWFDSDLEENEEYPFSGGTSIELEGIHTHPEFVPEAFFLHDLGVVILEEDAPAGDADVEIAEVGALDALATRRGLQDQLFTPVGYGLQSVKPDLRDDLVRYRATVRLIDVRGTVGIPEGAAVMFTNNPGKPHRGGTCFGDSGGPVFAEAEHEEDTHVIVAVTSFGLNANCAGTGGGYRVDQEDDRDFVLSFLD